MRLLTVADLEEVEILMANLMSLANISMNVLGKLITSMRVSMHTYILFYYKELL